MKETLALVRAANRLLRFLLGLVERYIERGERWLREQGAVVRLVWSFLLAPILLLKGLATPLKKFHHAVAAEMWPWLLAWSGWHVQLGMLEVWEVPAFMVFCAALPARIPARALKAWWTGACAGC